MLIYNTFITVNTFILIVRYIKQIKEMLTRIVGSMFKKSVDVPLKNWYEKCHVLGLYFKRQDDIRTFEIQA